MFTDDCGKIIINFPRDNVTFLENDTAAINLSFEIKIINAIYTKIINGDPNRCNIINQIKLTIDALDDASLLLLCDKNNINITEKIYTPGVVELLAYIYEARIFAYRKKDIWHILNSTINHMIYSIKNISIEYQCRKKHQALQKNLFSLVQSGDPEPCIMKYFFGQKISNPLENFLVGPSVKTNVCDKNCAEEMYHFGNKIDVPLEWHHQTNLFNSYLYNDLNDRAKKLCDKYVYRLSSLPGFKSLRIAQTQNMVSLCKYVYEKQFKMYKGSRDKEKILYYSNKNSPMRDIMVNTHDTAVNFTNIEINRPGKLADVRHGIELSSDFEYVDRFAFSLGQLTYPGKNAKRILICKVFIGESIEHVADNYMTMAKYDSKYIVHTNEVTNCESKIYVIHNPLLVLPLFVVDYSTN